MNLAELETHAAEVIASCDPEERQATIEMLEMVTERFLTVLDVLKRPEQLH